MCNKNRHAKCVKIKEDGIICFGCDATGKQMNLVHEIVDDLTFDAGDVNTSTQLPNKENTELKIYEDSTQTEGSFTDLQKKTKEVNLKEKQLNKKEYELSQINSQLTVAKSKIILLEKDISDLQKENELLKCNLLLARSSNNSHCGKGEIHSTHISDTNIIEKRIKHLEFEMLKMK